MYAPLVKVRYVSCHYISGREFSRDSFSVKIIFWWKKETDPTLLPGLPLPAAFLEAEVVVASRIWWPILLWPGMQKDVPVAFVWYWIKFYLAWAEATAKRRAKASFWVSWEGHERQSSVIITVFNQRIGLQASSGFHETLTEGSSSYKIWASITTQLVEIKIKSIVACKQTFQAGAAVPFHRSLTNGWARSTINHAPATLHYCLCRHFIALHFVWKCILDASYRKCSWHCPDLYWRFIHCILWSFPQILVMNAQCEWLKCKV